MTSIVVAAVLLPSAAIVAQPLPGAPGDSREPLAVPGPCPAFTWTAAAGATGYELVVLGLVEGIEDGTPQPVARRTLPAGLTIWTPALSECLAPGLDYAWAVRARMGEEWSPWSEPLFFRVPPGPTAADVERVLAVLAADRSERVAAYESATAGAVLPAAAAPPDSPPAASNPPPPGNPIAHLTVEGEVRTTDSTGAPRLWGRGRPGVLVYAQGIIGFCTNSAGTEFGLSNAVTTWGAAADACPAGTWVCTAAEVEPCDTTRPDTDHDGRGCTGIIVDWDADKHFGWVADLHGPGTGSLRRETDPSTWIVEECARRPVWCCG